MRILILGATGLAGTALVEAWKRPENAADEVFGAGSRDADIRDAAAVTSLVSRAQPDCILLLAAMTDVDACERDPEQAHQINAQGPENVARAAAAAAAKLIFVSTDYVFDGAKAAPYEPHDPMHPLSIYGRSKAAGEEAVARLLKDSCIVRTSWIFGTARRCFPQTVLERAREKNELRIIGDQTGVPTYAPDLARILMRLVRAGASGLLHAASSGSCTYAQWARVTLDLAGLDHVQVVPIASSEVQRPAPRPRYSVLSTASLLRYHISPRPWQDAVRDYVGEWRRQETQYAGPGLKSPAQANRP